MKGGEGRMIKEVKIYECPKCGSEEIVKNGKSGKKQKYHCNECGAYGTLGAQRGYSEAEKEQIIRAYQERASMRGIERMFGVARQTLAAWLKKKPRAYPR